jgi:hypothetical protein
MARTSGSALARWRLFASSRPEALRQRWFRSGGFCKTLDILCMDSISQRISASWLPLLFGVPGRRLFSLPISSGGCA